MAEPRIPPELETDRLLLRRWHEADLDALAAVFAQPKVWECPLGRGLDRAETERFLARQIEGWGRHGFGLYAVVVRHSGELAGYVGLERASWFEEIANEIEVGWRLGTSLWGNGYATEGALASLRAGSASLGVDRVLAVIEPANDASLRVAGRLGMQFLRETHEPGLDKTVHLMEMTRARFDQLDRAAPVISRDTAGSW